MKDINKVILVGRLGADPVKRETGNGLAVASFSVATSRKGREEGVTQTQWHKIVAWGKQAEICATYLKKGQSVYVEGSMRTRKYEAKDGSERLAFEIHADDVSFFGGGARAAREGTSGVAGKGRVNRGGEPGAPDASAGDENAESAEPRVAAANGEGYGEYEGGETLAAG